MMIFPNCPDHGRLVLDLALGRLDDEAAAETEIVSESCPVCRAWWREQFEGTAANVVDEAVAETFTDLRLPARRRRRGWMAAAAAAVMALGVGSLWVSQNSLTVDDVAAQRSVSIRTIDFEPSDAVGDFALIEAPDPELKTVAPPSAERVVFEETLVAAATPVVVEDSAEQIFSGAFETGDLTDWVPST